MPGIASAATSVVLGHIAAGTKNIRIGAGGIMLPNHAPYVIAEQFGTLARLFPGRIDLGLGRAPGTDQLTLRALRRTPEAAENFPQDVLELQAFLAPAGPNQRIQAVPASGTEVPLWILGSSNFGAMLAAEFGLPYAFASHFAPNSSFRRCKSTAAVSSLPNSLTVPMPWWASISSPPRATPKRPVWRRPANVIRKPVPRHARAQPAADRRHRKLLVAIGEGPGGADACPFHHRIAETVRSGIEALVAETSADELIVVSDLYDHTARLRSFELIADAAEIERQYFRHQP